MDTAFRPRQWILESATFQLGARSSAEVAGVIIRFSRPWIIIVLREVDLMTFIPDGVMEVTCPSVLMNSSGSEESVLSLAVPHEVGWSVY